MSCPPINYPMSNHLSAARCLTFQKNSTLRRVRHHRPTLYDILILRVHRYIAGGDLESIPRHELDVLRLHLERPTACYVNVSVLVYRDGTAVLGASDENFNITAFVHLDFRLTGLQHMDARRCLSGISTQLIRDFLIFAPRHRSALRRTYYYRIILIAIHKLTYYYRADIGVAEYTIAHIIATKKWRDNFSIWKLLRLSLVLNRIYAWNKHLKSSGLKMPDDFSPKQTRQLVSALAVYNHLLSAALSVFLICFSTLRRTIFSRRSFASAPLPRITCSTNFDVSGFMSLEFFIVIFYLPYA